MPKVLEAIQQQMDSGTNTAFPANAQYVKKLKEADEHDETINNTACKDTAVKSGGFKAGRRTRVGAKNKGAPSPAKHVSCVTSQPKGEPNYASLRKQFVLDFAIYQAKAGSKATPHEAQSAWLGSTKRAQILGTMSVNELKRRRFLPKGATVNPFAQQG